jgi:hydrogenase/urease accessory protein HupE
VTVRWLGLVLVLAGTPALAHPLAPSVLELRETGGGRVGVTWKTPLLRADGSNPAPLLPARCVVASPPVVTTEGLGRVSRWAVDCGTSGLAGTTIGVADPGSPAPSAVVRITRADGRVLESLVVPERPLAVPLDPSALALARDAGRRGLTHVLRAGDHLLFLLGLVLLGGSGRRLAATVAAFVVAHSVTLTLATLGVIAEPAPVVAAAIAASILVLALELARRPAPPTVVGRYPWMTAAVFGLIHGLGFALALRKAGLPGDVEPLALLAFNAGLEAGQLGFVLGVLALRRGADSLAIGWPWLGRVPAYAMGSLAVLWSLERAAALLR